MATSTLDRALAAASDAHRAALLTLHHSVSRVSLATLQGCLADVPDELRDAEPDAVHEIRLVAWRRVCSEAWPSNGRDADTMLAHWLAFAETEGLVDGDTRTFLAVRALLAAPSAESALDTYMQHVASDSYAYTDATLADVADVVTDSAMKVRFYLLSAIAEYCQVEDYLPNPTYETQLRAFLANARSCGATDDDYKELVAWVEARTHRALAPDLFDRFA